MYQFLDASTPLIVNGKPRYGHFADSLRIINRDDFTLRNAFGEERNRFARWVGNKDFQYIGGMSDTLIFGCALANLRYMAIAFVYVYHIESRQLWSRSWRSPLGVGYSPSSNPVEGETRFHLPGLVDIRAVYRPNPREKVLTVRCQGLHLEGRFDEQDYQPMSICTRTGYSGFTYTNKVTGRPMHGFLELEGKRYDLDEIGAYGSLDFSCGYMRRETWWNWGCFSGEVKDGPHKGRKIGLNVSCGVNETGFSENCFWLDGKLIPLNFTRFHFDPEKPLEPWEVEADDGKLQLRFQPFGMHREVVRTGLITTHFRQVFGEFSGCMRVDGEEISLNGQKGFLEDQFIRW